MYFFTLLGDYIYLLFSCISLGMPVGPGIIGRHWSSLVIIGRHRLSLAVIGFQTHRWIGPPRLRDWAEAEPETIQRRSTL